MKTITKQAWSLVHEKALDVVNASMRDDFVMVDVCKEQMLDLLTELEVEFGVQPKLLATRADYLEDVVERRSLYKEALKLARQQKDEEEVAEILDSLQSADGSHRQRTVHCAGPTKSHGAVRRGGVTDPVQRRVQTLVSPQ